MPTQEDTNRHNKQLQKLADATAKDWYKGSAMDTAANLPAEMRKLAGNFEEVSCVADAWKDFGNIDSTHKKFGGTATDVTQEDIEELARKDPSLKKKLDIAKMEETTLEFVRTNRQYLSTDANFPRWLNTWEGNISTCQISVRKMGLESFMQPVSGRLST
jgi:hypothetical protein